MVKAQPLITEQDLEKLLNAPMRSHSSQIFKINTLIQLLWDSGARISEIVSLQVKDFDYEAKLLTFRDTKNKEDRRVPVTNEMADRLKKLTKGQSMGSYVFKGQGNGHMTRIAAYAALKRRLKRSGIKKNIRPHTFRHRLITDKLNKKLPLFKVQKFVGHKSAQSTSLYYHFTTDDLREVLEA